MLPWGCKLDTGAKANVIPFTFFTIYNHELACRKKTYQALTSYGNYRVIPVGKVTLNSTMKTQTHCLSFFVVDIPSFPVLGFQASTQFGLVEKIDSMVEPVCSKKMVLYEYKDVFEGLGCMPQEYTIEIPSDAVPFVQPPLRVPSSLHGKLMETLNRMEKNGVITHVDRHTDWVNSLVKLAGRSMFSILDEKDGFWQILLDEESSFLCTFNSYFGQYRFLRCPFGIRAALEVSKMQSPVVWRY